jgi:hypothetical protein
MSCLFDHKLNLKEQAAPARICSSQDTAAHAIIKNQKKKLNEPSILLLPFQLQSLNLASVCHLSKIKLDLYGRESDQIPFAPSYYSYTTL